MPPPKDKVYTEMEALIQHFLIYSQGFTVPAGEAYVPVEGPRGEHGFYDRVGRHQPAVARQVARAVVLACQALPNDDRRRPDRRRHRRHRIDRRRDGRRGPMSFHPQMAYDADRSTSRSASSPTRGRRSRTRREPRAVSTRSSTRYPPDRKRSAVLPALYLVQEQQGYITANAMRHVAGMLDMHAGGRRGRRVVLHDVLHEAGRQVRAAGLPHAVVRAERRRARHRGAVARSSGIKPGETDPSGHVHAARVECLGACDRAPVVMVNDSTGTRCLTPETRAKLVDDIERAARRRCRAVITWWNER